jgi:hypothetical protein
MPTQTSMQPPRFTAIWQSRKPRSRDWIDELFGPYLLDHVTDGNRELVLDNSILIDEWIYARDLSYYARFAGRNAFLIHLQDECYEIGVEAYKHFRGVFRGFWSGIFRPNHVMILPIGYNMGMRGITEPKPAAQRQYLWSFAGQVDKSSRPEMVRALADLQPSFLLATDSLDANAKRLSNWECAELLRNSKFAPSPMGNANIESYRVYEALEAGAIPIVERRLTLDYYHRLLGDHPLPTVRSWREARELIDNLARRPGDANLLQERCVTWWARYKAQYSVQVGAFLERQPHHRSEIGAVVSPLAKVPMWQSIELLRHHDSRALARRVKKQAVRMAKQGKLRVAYRKGDLT